MSSNGAAVTALVEAVKAKNLSAAPLAEDVWYQSPLTGEPIRGRAHVMRFLAAYLPVLKDIQIERQIDDGSYTAVVWRAETSFGQRVAFLREGFSLEQLVKGLFVGIYPQGKKLIKFFNFFACSKLVCNRG